MKAVGKTERSWSSIRWSRALIGLGLSPLIPTALCVAMLGSLIFEFEPDRRLHAARSILVLGFMEIWAYGVGLACLLWFRRQGSIGRRDCLLMGMLGAFTFPLAIGIAGIAIQGFPDMDAVSFLAGGAALLSLAAIPFGLFGGWIFWRLAVYAAPINDSAEVTVFE
jgi:hypothetical protein